ncbi:aldehyde dehydrogenase family protein [Streptomyces sp. NPDC086519]|uniref:aldehyde dehydrogenase family protein n=1 Tax=Streptomyces sp. NPDC086519 TaxID=3154863 RepID=UPI003444AFFD
MGSGRGAAVPLPDLAVADAEGQEAGAQAQGGQGEEGDAVGEGAAGAIGAPFGGYRHSGFGRSMGPDYLEDWTQVKCLVINAG